MNEMMKEITITTNKVGFPADPGIHIWGWDVSLYLFLGGLTAGILVIAGLMVLRRGGGAGGAIRPLIVLAPVLLSVGMFFLWLDLENKLNVWRFYTAFQFTSPMSWGSWILLLVYPLSLGMILATFRRSYPRVVVWLESRLNGGSRIPGIVFRVLGWLMDFCEARLVVIARLVVPVGVLLGIYTGILLSSFGARPFWNSALLGPLFLVSGLSTAVALAILFSTDHDERHFFARLDLGLIGVELGIILLFIFGLASSPQPHRRALELILGGPMTAVFWVLIVGMGLLLPAFLKVLEIKNRSTPVVIGTIAASLVLIGGLVLRAVMVEAGQLSAWIP